MPEASTFIGKVALEIQKRANTAKGAGAGAGHGHGLPVLAFSVGMPSALPLGVGGMLGRAEEKSLEKGLREQLGESLRGHVLFDGVWTREMLATGLGGRVWRCLWGCLGGKFGDFVQLERVEGWVDGVVLEELQAMEGIGGGGGQGGNDGDDEGETE